MASELARLETAERMLAEIDTADEAVAVIRFAEAARVWARQMQLGLSAVNHATAIKLRAERRLADVVDAGQAAGEIASRSPGWNQHEVRPESGPTTLTDLGVDKRRLSEARELRDNFTDADISEQAEQATEEGRQLSRTALARPAHVRHNTGENEWYTPPEYISAAYAVMGGIDLDPASSAEANEQIGAISYHTAEDDGLAREWDGRVWLNPPYERGLVDKFIVKLAEEFENGRVAEAIVLVNNSTDSGWHQQLSALSSARCEPLYRIRFWHPGGRQSNPLQGQVIHYLGTRPQVFREHFSRFGYTLVVCNHDQS